MRAAAVVVALAALTVGASASANIDASHTARTAQTAAATGDCNGNGVPDFSEGAFANRDDDGDGFCNGVDYCPYEAGAVNDGSACQMQAVTVPARPGDPAAAHPTYSGASTILKGVARYGGNQFKWDFGDGTPPTAWMSIADPYDLGVAHVYSGAVGQLFIATLSVRSSANPSVVSTATYRVQIGDGGTSPQSLTVDQFDVRRAMAVDQGLWYLHRTLQRGRYADGARGYSQPYGLWGGGDLNADCLAVDAFELHGSTPAGSAASDPYAEDVQRVLARVLTMLNPQQIALQQHGNPDANGNGLGLSFGTASTTTVTSGRCLMALADGGAPSRRAASGGANVLGRTYAEIGQDAVDWLAFGQEENGLSRGGWGYSVNSGTATAEMERWVILGLKAAEQNLGATVPSFVRTELPYRLTYIRSTYLNDYNGSAGDFNWGDIVTVAFTAAAIVGDEFVGNSASYVPTQRSEGYIYRHWNDNNGVWITNLGDSDAMYTVMRAMTGMNPPQTLLKNFNYTTGVQVPGGFDWMRTAAGQSQEGVGTNLLRRQAAAGNWTDSTGIGGAYAVGTYAQTALDVAILMARQAQAPVADIGGPYSALAVNEQATLDASASTSSDGSALTYAWDLDNDGAFDDAAGSTAVFSSAALGTYPVCVRVTDGGGRSSSACTQLSVTPPPHPPHAVLADALVGVNVPVQLDASQSYDADGDPLTYAWDLDNDGQFDDATGASATATFATTGQFVVAVQVTDHPAQNPSPYNAPSSTVTAFATVEVGAHAPIADAGGPYTGAPGQSILLDASASSDPNGSALSYGWDLNNDGIFTDSPLATTLFTIGVVPVGTVYSVCVRVENAFLKRDTACTTVTVIAQHVPPVAQVVPASQVVAGPLPRTVTLDGSHSYDPGGGTLTYAWTTDDADGTTADASAAIATHTFGHYGVYHAHLVVDSTFFSSSADETITVVDQTPPGLTAPGDLTLAEGPTRVQQVNAWLASATATDDDPDHPAPSVANDFAGVVPGQTVTVTWTATDYAGNTTSKSATLTVQADTTPPVVTPVVDGTIGDNGWYRSDVHVTWQVADAESGISSSTGCDETDITADTSTAGVAVTCSATSAGGTTTQTVHVKRDATPPTITATRTPPPNAAGWNDADVTVTYVCDDGLSGIAHCDTPTVLHEGTDQAATGTATDNAGNSATATVGGIDVDETAPSLTGAPTTAPNLNGWYRGDVTIHWTCSDSGGSGVDGACPADSSVGSEGAGLTATASVADRAGNVTAAASGAVRIDRTPPVTTASAPTGWTNAGVTVALAATDNLSGVAVTYYSLDGAPTAYGGSVAIDTEGRHTLVYWSVDGADNVEATHSVDVLIDRSAPTISHVLSPGPNGAGWNNGDVGVTFSCGDALSGIAFCSPVQLLTGEGREIAVTGTATDNAGNSAHDSVSVSIDRTPPTIAAAVDRAPNANGWYDADVVVSFACGDALSGVASCPAAFTLGEGASQSASASAADVAGNTASASVSGVNVDKSAPTVTYTGSAGTYAVDETVDIRCAASDALSGVASTTCADIGGPAWSFGLGTTSRSASATDLAGNVGSGSVTFTVGVTCDGVKRLIAAWVTNRGVAASLQAKVDSICTAPNATAKAGKVGAFVNQVAAQKGKTLTPDQAGLLEQYADRL